jgi:hypothetical protein
MKKNRFREDNFAAVAAAVEEGRRQTVWGLASVLDQSKDTFSRNLSEDLVLEKRSDCSVPKLLNGDQKKDSVDKCNSLLKLMWSTGLSVLDIDATTDESTMPFLTPETKKQSSNWSKKGQSGPF